MPVTLPRKIVIEAFGRVNVAGGPDSTVATGGWSGSGRLFGPSLIHTYCSSPNETTVTGPVNDVVCFRVASSNTTCTVWALAESRLTSISDQLPSGRCTAYEVTN